MHLINPQGCIGIQNFINTFLQPAPQTTASTGIDQVTNRITGPKNCIPSGSQALPESGKPLLR